MSDRARSLSVGSYQTPQILELSGIGNKELLNKHGIETLIDLPGVGENLREFSVASKHILPFIDSSSRGDCPSCLQPCFLALAYRKQDHMYVPIVSEIDPQYETLDMAREPEAAASLQEQLYVPIVIFASAGHSPEATLLTGIPQTTSERRADVCASGDNELHTSENPVVGTSATEVG